MKINLTVENAEFAFIKHAIQEQTKQLVEYFDAMHKVATYMVEPTKEELNAEQQAEPVKMGNAFTVNKRAAARKQVRRTRK